MKATSLRDWLALVWEKYLFKEHRFFIANRQPYIIDAGANVGSVTLELKKHYPQAKIVAIEPSPETFKILRENTKDLKNVQLVNAALSNHRGKIKLFVSRTGPSFFSDGPLRDTTVPSFWHKDKKIKIISVPAVLLSDYVKQPIDLLKMDIEGDETKVLKKLGTNSGTNLPLVASLCPGSKKSTLPRFSN
ncbi:MAG: Methyltransferase FkbM family [Microgenomates group bacterium GW2011_GWA1_48_10]|uniref:Methyltransferase FkbM domain-containing protein n=1 Tax=Candidatus Gottesmanbacteria bacterium RIFCSPHIGHO2_01_FULL_47_48 TaxID=1798381 RepID=A0A1F6A334_9BACT|nr:MAG: Methyltransferase FkbM family [Microgenomates group bacterium GW2011_GWA1_48_10]OGG19075.1 MAG: hypothetical protein A2721_00750 [Candidatus Gottesmanbacteria bacterium RIFCSPHIGHO2_01_FULL_47_48]